MQDVEKNEVEEETVEEQEWGQEHEEVKEEVEEEEGEEEEVEEDEEDWGPWAPQSVQKVSCSARRRSGSEGSSGAALYSPIQPLKRGGRGGGAPPRNKKKFIVFVFFVFAVVRDLVSLVKKLSSEHSAMAQLAAQGPQQARQKPTQPTTAPPSHLIEQHTSEINVEDVEKHDPTKLNGLMSSVRGFDVDVSQVNQMLGKQPGRVRNILAPVSHVRFTQKSVKNRFQDGRSLDHLVDQLKSGDVDSESADFLALSAVRMDGIFWSWDNRRLLCLKRFQQSVPHVVYAQLHMYDWDRFRQRLDTENGGQSVRVRGNGMLLHA